MLDYEKHINKFTFSVGGKYSYINTNNQLAFYNVENGTPVLDHRRSSEFSYLEQIAAAYFILTQNQRKGSPLMQGTGWKIPRRWAN